ncbi:hypothetical protein FBBAL38_04620 [Flavobacteria bacterium BAL38]|nr:hypothetical protein FBBAL38_04620 [Flavobacteria bacterium BAL38]
MKNLNTRRNAFLQNKTDENIFLRKTISVLNKKKGEISFTLFAPNLP